MSKKKKLGIIAVLYVFILAVAMVVAFFIAKANLGKDFAPKAADDFEIEYDSGGENPTTTKAVVRPSAQVVSITSTVSKIYELEAEMPFKVENGTVSFEVVPDVEANMVEAYIGFFGAILPTKFVGELHGECASGAEGTVFTIRFVDPTKPDEPNTIGSFTLTEEQVQALGIK